MEGVGASAQVVGVVDDNAAAQDVPQSPPVSRIVEQDLSPRTRDALDRAFPFGRSASRTCDVSEQRFKPRLSLARCAIHGRRLPYRLLCGSFHRRGPECIWWNALEVSIGSCLELVGELIDGLDIVEEPGNVPGNATEEEREEDRVEAR